MFLAGKQERRDSKRVRELKELELERSKTRAFKKVKLDKNRVRKTDVEVAMRMLDSKNR